MNCTLSNLRRNFSSGKKINAAVCITEVVKFAQSINLPVKIGVKIENRKVN